MNTTLKPENPFTYSPQNADISAYNYKRIDPSPFWSTGKNYVAKKTKKIPKSTNIEKKIVRNVKTLPKHLIARYKPPKSKSDKSRVCFNFIQLSLRQLITIVNK